MRLPDVIAKNRVFQFAHEVWTNYSREGSMLSAAAIAFYLFLSLVPFILTLVSIASFFIDPVMLEARAADLSRALGPGVGDVIQEEILAVVRARGVITGVLLLFGLWAGSQVFLIIEITMDRVWNVEESRSIIVRRSLALLMVLVTGLLFGITLLLTNFTRTLLRADLPGVAYRLSDIPFLFTVLIEYVVPILVVTLTFGIIYRYLTAQRVTWRVVIRGAFIAAVAWVVGVHIFSWYATRFADYSVLYGSLGGLILLLLWFNIGAQIMLLGAEIAQVLHKRRVQAGKAEQEFEEPGKVKPMNQAA